MFQDSGGLSPRAQRAGARARAEQRAPAFKRTDAEWKVVKDGGAVPCQSGRDERQLDSFIAKYGLKHSTGRGYTIAGKRWRPSFGIKVRKYRCLFQKCPAELRVTCRDGYACIEKAGAATKCHNGHQEIDR